ncbi:hypothetical protein D3C80_2238000 [compost metagenome]
MIAVNDKHRNAMLAKQLPLLQKRKLSFERAVSLVEQITGEHNKINLLANGRLCQLTHSREG